MTLSSGGAQVSDLRDEALKYVYLDVVSFSHDRPAEAQAYIIRSLNTIVIKALHANYIPRPNAILLPTGDGMCIALIEMPAPYDIHLRLALSIIGFVDEHNLEIGTGPRNFEVRIGINEETDITYTDINERRNVAGAGVNMAQRIMNAADGNQVLLGEKVYGTVVNRESYRKEDFRSFVANIKHGGVITIYQFIRHEQHGLNTDEPSSETDRKELADLRIALERIAEQGRELDRTQKTREVEIGERGMIRMTISRLSPGSKILFGLLTIFCLFYFAQLLWQIFYALAR